MSPSHHGVPSREGVTGTSSLAVTVLLPRSVVVLRAVTSIHLRRGTVGGTVADRNLKVASALPVAFAAGVNFQQAGVDVRLLITLFTVTSPPFSVLPAATRARSPSPGKTVTVDVGEAEVAGPKA